MWAMSAARWAPTSSAIAANAAKSRLPRVRRVAAPDELGPVLAGERAHLVHVDAVVVLSHPVLHRAVVDAGRRDLPAVGEVAARRQGETHGHVARLAQREQHREVGRRAAVGLHVGVLGPEQRLGARSIASRLERIDEVHPLVVALAGVALGVLVGQARGARLRAPPPRRSSRSRSAAGSRAGGGPRPGQSATPRDRPRRGRAGIGRTWAECPARPGRCQTAVGSELWYRLGAMQALARSADPGGDAPIAAPVVPGGVPRWTVRRRHAGRGLRARCASWHRHRGPARERGGRRAMGSLQLRRPGSPGAGRWGPSRVARCGCGSLPVRGSCCPGCRRGRATGIGRCVAVLAALRGPAGARAAAGCGAGWSACGATTSCAASSGCRCRRTDRTPGARARAPRRPTPWWCSTASRSACR